MKLWSTGFETPKFEMNNISPEKNDFAENYKLEKESLKLSTLLMS
jgi:hypothetical protein